MDYDVAVARDMYFYTCYSFFGMFEYDTCGMIGMVLRHVRNSFKLLGYLTLSYGM